jgi:hypothetical protein
MILLLVSNCSSGQNCVPKRNDAIRIAEAEWDSVGYYGYKKKPYVVKLIGDSVWTIQGAFDPKLWAYQNPKTGVIYPSLPTRVYIEIRKKDCKILNIVK